MKHRIPVFYKDAQIHDPSSFSKSPLKPKLLAERIALDRAFEIKSRAIHAVTCTRLEQTHDAKHVKALINGTEPDGFGNYSAEHNKAIRTTVGNYLAAADWAVTARREGAYAIHPGVVWSLTSGFHHAGRNFSGAFCTFEALTLAAFEARIKYGLTTLIIDEDAHYGNGCVDVIDHSRMQSYCHYMQSKHTHDSNDLDRFEAELLRTIKHRIPGVIMYQAAADNWTGDPLGGMLTTRELFARDMIVMEVAKFYKVPLVVNLAGGYAHNFEDTLQIHMNTGEAMKQVYLGLEAKPIYAKKEGFTCLQLA